MLVCSVYGSFCISCIVLLLKCFSSVCMFGRLVRMLWKKMWFYSCVLGCFFSVLSMVWKNGVVCLVWLLLNLV